MTNEHKNLVLTVDFGGCPDWQVVALQNQMKDWLEINKSVLDIEKLVILPTVGETKLYWLNGSTNDIKTLEQIRDRIEPVLQVAMNLKLDKEKRFKAPYNKTTKFFRHG